MLYSVVEEVVADVWLGEENTLRVQDLPREWLAGLMTCWNAFYGESDESGESHSFDHGLEGKNEGLYSAMGKLS